MLGQSRASGLLLVPEYRGNPMADTLEQVRGRASRLREVISLADWDEFLASGVAAERAARGDPERPGPDPVHLGHHRLPEGRRAAPPGDHQQRPALHGPPAARPRRRLGQPDAAVPHRRLRGGHARRRSQARGTQVLAPWLRPRPDASTSSSRSAATMLAACRRCCWPAGAPAVPRPRPAAPAQLVVGRRHRPRRPGPPGGGGAGRAASTSSSAQTEASR